MIKIDIVLITAFALAACAGPTRNDAKEFEQIDEGKISKDQVLPFVDCLTDGFNKSHWGITNYEVRQSIRAVGFRVETYTGSMNYLLVSADVMNDGNVGLYESSAAALINTKGEREVFTSCLEKFTSAHQR